MTSREGGGATRIRPPDPTWILPERPDAERVAALAAELRLPPVVCSVLVGRGIDVADEAKRFLRPRLDHLHDPADLADGIRAAERIARAISSGEGILVHGDYDVDGICATALLTRWLRSLGASVVPFVPHRLRDGYDFSRAGIDAALQSGVGLVVTADCGTVAHEAIREARVAGLDVVVTDHHTVGAELPDAFAVVNPQRPDCPYAEKGLCGTGVAYKLCELVARTMGRPTEELTEYLDLVALATVADLVPLTGENRVLVAFGLRRMARTRVPGLAALLEAAGLDPEDLTSGRLGFVVAPRINAAGRVGDSADALRLLLTEDASEARRLAEMLDAANRSRREEDRRTLDEALELLDASYDPERDYGVVLAAEGWHPGVIGIVASRVVERIHRPVVMIALEGASGRGSARSIPGFHLHEALTECSGFLKRFGGHRQAAGMDVDREALEGFRAAFNEVAARRLAGEDLRPVLRPDVELSLDVVDLELVHWMGYLGPHGIGNPGPLFLASRVTFSGGRVVGDGHLKVRLSAGRSAIDGIGFGLAERHPAESLGSLPHDVLFRLEKNVWRGVAKPQARLADLRPSGSGATSADGRSGSAP
ncbi:MAG: single-stranded-DNA-specific exonuclease RecJ [Gemmatimonadota bacterium]